jgi:nitrilase
MTKYIAAVVQASSYPEDSLKSALKAADMIREASSRGARLAVFPEAFIGGYPKGASFGAPIGLRKQEGRSAFQLYYEAAIDVDGDAVKTIAASTAETGLFAVVGCIG